MRGQMIHSEDFSETDDGSKLYAVSTHVVAKVVLYLIGMIICPKITLATLHIKKQICIISLEVMGNVWYLQIQQDFGDDSQFLVLDFRLRTVPEIRLPLISNEVISKCLQFKCLDNLVFRHEVQVIHTSATLFTGERSKDLGWR